MANLIHVLYLVGVRITVVSETMLKRPRRQSIIGVVWDCNTIRLSSAHQKDDMAAFDASPVS
jgi:hypothetical protein